MPNGGLCADHEVPPLIVPIMVDPSFELPLLPTAMQSSALSQEIPVSAIAFEGTDCAAQFIPEFEVPMTYGVELEFEPIAMHVSMFGQETALSSVPVGIEVGAVQAIPPSRVASVVASPPEALPTAIQVES
jgi:hypothetical protein